MNINEYLAKKKEFEELTSKNGIQLLSSLFEDLFNNSNYKEVTWTQYTPYFNDGEACVFSVRYPSFLTEQHINTKKEEDLDYDDYDFGDTVYGCPSENKKLLEDFQEKLYLLENVFEAAFGDHAKIRAFQKDGKIEFEVEEYEHE